MRRNGFTQTTNNHSQIELKQGVNHVPIPVHRQFNIHL